MTYFLYLGYLQTAIHPLTAQPRSPPVAVAVCACAACGNQGSVELHTSSSSGSSGSCRLPPRRCRRALRMVTPGHKGTDLPFRRRCWLSAGAMGAPLPTPEPTRAEPCLPAERPAPAPLPAAAASCSAGKGRRFLGGAAGPSRPEPGCFGAGTVGWRGATPSRAPPAPSQAGAQAEGGLRGAVVGGGGRVFLRERALPSGVLGEPSFLPWCVCLLAVVTFGLPCCLTMGLDRCHTAPV